MYVKYNVLYLFSYYIKVWLKYDYNELFNFKKYFNIFCVRGVNFSRIKIRIFFRKDMVCIM